MRCLLFPDFLRKLWDAVSSLDLRYTVFRRICTGFLWDLKETCHISFEADLALYLNKLESPLRRDNLYQVWLNLACWFWRRRSIFFLNFQCTFTLLPLSPLGEGQSPSFEQTWIPSPKDDLCQVWLKLAQRFWRRSRKCKSLQTDRQADRRTARQTTDKMRSE